ncbi:MAG TPA: hypothetical protein VGB68_09220 [Pyrinomonadaceae bacterium]|jgi:hypothetical protein
MRKITFGRNSRLNKLFQLFAILLALCSAGFAQERTWKTFSPAGGAWSILAPGELRPDAEAQESPSTKGSYSYSDFNGFFAVIYRDSPKRWVPWKPNYNAYFKKIRKDAVEAAKGQLLKDEEFSSGDLTGREVYIKVPVGTLVGAEGLVITKYRVERLRMFFREKRFYLLMAVLPEADVNSPEANNYFNSFTAK